MENQTEIKERLSKAYDRFGELVPEVGPASRDSWAECFKGGAMSAKNKRLAAVTASVCAGCRGCIMFQTQLALEAGASVDELLEACGVAVALGGSMAGAHATRVVMYLEEQGLI